MPARAKWSTKHAFLTFFATFYANFVVFAEVVLCVDFCKRKIFCICVLPGVFSQAIAPKNAKRRCILSFIHSFGRGQIANLPQ